MFGVYIDIFCIYDSCENDNRVDTSGTRKETVVQGSKILGFIDYIKRIELSQWFKYILQNFSMS